MCICTYNPKDNFVSLDINQKIDVNQIVKCFGKHVCAENFAVLPSALFSYLSISNLTCIDNFLFNAWLH